MPEEKNKKFSLRKSIQGTRSGNGQIGGDDIMPDLSGLTFTPSGQVIEAGTDTSDTLSGSSDDTSKGKE